MPNTVASINSDTISKNNEKSDEIFRNAKPFYCNRTIDDGVLGAFITELESMEMENEDLHDVANDMELQEEENYTDGFLTEKKTKKFAFDCILKPKVIPDNDYKCVMNGLNSEQRKITMHVLNNLKKNGEPFNIFLTG